MSRTADYGLNPVARPEPRFRFGKAATSADQTALGISFTLLILFLLVFYSNLAKLVPQLEVLRPALIVSAAAAAALIFELAKDRRSFRVAWPQGYLFAAMLGVAAVSTLQAIYIRLGYETTSDLAKIALVYLVVENTITSESRVRRILWTLVVGGLFPAIGTSKVRALRG
jgi:hypothetical protein